MITVDLRGADKVFERNRRFRSQITGTIVGSLRRSLRKTEKNIQADLRGLPIVQGILRGKWARLKRNQLGARVKTITLQVGENKPEIEAAIGLYGYPAVLEEGGQFLQHMIYVAPGRTTRRPRNWKKRTTFEHGAYSVKHPGARVSGHGFGGSNFHRNESATLYQLDKDVSELMARIYGV